MAEDTPQVENEGLEVPPVEHQEISTDKVIVGDQEYEVPASVASYLNEQTRRLSDTETALSYAKELTRPAPEPAVAPQQVQEDRGFSVDDSEFFSNPAATFAKFTEHLSSQIDQKLTNVRSDYTKDQQRRDYWHTFYNENPELKGYETIVDGTFAANKDTWSNQPLSNSRKLLAEEARKTLLGIAGKFGGASSSNNGNDLTTPSGKSKTKVPPKQEEEKLVSLSDEIRARQEKRRSASIN